MNHVTIFRFFHNHNETRYVRLSSGLPLYVREFLSSRLSQATLARYTSNPVPVVDDYSKSRWPVTLNSAPNRPAPLLLSFLAIHTNRLPLLSRSELYVRAIAKSNGTPVFCWVSVPRVVFGDAQIITSLMRCSRESTIAPYIM